MAKDIHAEPFDDGTKAKLSIFKDYIREWLPVFIKAQNIYWTKINICDFFAGPGEDSTGYPGTPKIILEELLPYQDDLFQKQISVHAYFNEYDKKKASQLDAALEEYYDPNYPISFTLDSLDFSDAFKKVYPHLKGCANLLFLDQNGIKHITPEVFSALIKIDCTDFLFFISSSTIKRFADHSSIARYHNMDPNQIAETPYHKFHRLVTDYYKSLVSEGKEYYISSFSLKKKGNIYGLIFGSGHILGMEKFLRSCWSMDPLRGEANYDIDNEDKLTGQYDMFTGEATLKRLAAFKLDLTKRIQSRDLLTDKDLYIYVIKSGFLPIHARDVLKEMKNNKVRFNLLNLSSKVCRKNAVVTNILQ